MVGSVRQFEKGEEQDMMRGLMDSAVGRLVGPLRVCILCSNLSVLLNCFVESGAADNEVARKQYCLVQNCEPLAVLFGHDEKDHWRGCCSFHRPERVNNCCVRHYPRSLLLE